jgi:hypothetical protein
VYSSVAYLIRTKASDIPFSYQFIAAYLDQKDEKMKRKLELLIDKDFKKVQIASKDFEKKGSSFRFEGIFEINLQEIDDSLLALEIFEEINRTYSNWVNELFFDCARKVDSQIYPGIAFTFHRALQTIICPHLLSHKSNDALNFKQRELISMIERILKFNLTGFTRDIGDRAFTLWGLKREFKLKGLC